MAETTQQPVVEKSTPAAVPAPGTPEHEAAMVKKFDSILPEDQREKTVEPQKPQRPADVPEQFWNAEKGEVNVAALLKSQSEAQRKITELSKPQTQQPAAVDPVKQHAEGKQKLVDALAAVKAKPDAKPEDIAAAEKAVTDYPAAPAAAEEKIAPSKLMEELAESFRTTGKLEVPEELYKKFEKAGIDKGTLDQHIEGQKALRREADARIMKTAGVSEEEAPKILEWAKANMKPEEAALFNATMNKSTDEAALALQGLKSRYVEANGNDPKLLGGNQGGASVQGYANVDQYKADIRNPLYDKSEAFRAEVERKLVVTTAF